MKKLMILVLVLGLTSVTNAALVLSLNGNTDISEITVAPSDEFTVDVYSATGLTDEFNIIFAGPASYSDMGTVHIPPAPSTLTVSEYQPGWLMGLQTAPVIDSQIGTWWDIVLHCDGEGDVIITLYDYSGWYVIDTAVVHQVPEPMTIALLGLGGLFLRRRK